MDLGPDLGEPGILDELFYFGPLVLQVVLGAFFFWCTGRWIKDQGWAVRAFIAVNIVLVVDLFLLVAFALVVTQLLNE